MAAHLHDMVMRSKAHNVYAPLDRFSGWEKWEQWERWERWEAALVDG